MKALSLKQLREIPNIANILNLLPDPIIHSELYENDIVDYGEYIIDTSWAETALKSYPLLRIIRGVSHYKHYPSLDQFILESKLHLLTWILYSQGYGDKVCFKSPIISNTLIQRIKNMPIFNR